MSQQRVERTADVAWECVECGEVSPQNGTPCNNCGSFRYDKVEQEPAQTTEAGPETDDEDSNRRITVRWLLAYGWGAFMLLSAVGAVVQGAALAAAAITLAAAVAMPYSRKNIEASFGVEITTAATVALTVALYVAGLLLAEPYV